SILVHLPSIIDHLFSTVRCRTAADSRDASKEAVGPMCPIYYTASCSRFALMRWYEEIRREPFCVVKPSRTLRLCESTLARHTMARAGLRRDYHHVGHWHCAAAGG